MTPENTPDLTPAEHEMLARNDYRATGAYLEIRKAIDRAGIIDLEDNLPKTIREECHVRVRVRNHVDHAHFLREYQAELRALNIAQLNDDMDMESIQNTNALAILLARRPLYAPVFTAATI